MSSLPILHHYPASPFSEKARLCLGLKGMPYHSVRIPAVMPKPDLVALTGGYRRTPVLQIGQHVYCDTTLITRVLDQIEPEPDLLCHPAAEVVAQWADGPLFDVAVAIGGRPTKLDVVLALMRPEELEKFVEDRKAMRDGGRRDLLHHDTALAHLPTYLDRIEGMLGATPFLLGERPSVADFAVYHCLWFLEMLRPEVLPGEGAIATWMARVKAIGHGRPKEMSSAEALDVCRAADQTEDARKTLAQRPAAPVEGAPIGQRVRIRADDWGRDPVEGELVTCTRDTMAIRRSDPRAGQVVVHFPRVGFELRAL